MPTPWRWPEEATLHPHSEGQSEAQTRQDVGSVARLPSASVAGQNNAGTCVPRRNTLTSQMLPAVDLPQTAPNTSQRASTSAGRLLKSGRLVAAIDMDCFYAQCEELRRPELRGKPVGVQQKALVITSNYAARAFGIAKGDSLRVVKEKCPHITICNGEDLTFYGEVSQRFFDVASRLTPKVEKLGLDEIFVDLSELVDERLASLGPETRISCECVLYPSTVSEVWELNAQNWQGLEDEERCSVRLCVAARICQELRTNILQEVGLTSSAGIGVSKLLAKMVASWRKPNLQTVVVPSSENLGTLLPDVLPVQKIPGIGFSSTKKCQEAGVNTVGEFLAASDSPDGELMANFDEKTVAAIRVLCLGLEDAEVKTSGPPKSCSVEDSFWQNPLRSDAHVVASLEALARKLLLKVRSDERRFGNRSVLTLAVTLRHAPPPGQPDEHVKRERKQVHLNGMLNVGVLCHGCPGSDEFQ